MNKRKKLKYKSEKLVLKSKVGGTGVRYLNLWEEIF